MAVRRQKNWLGQQRVDTTHLREVESAVASDFDDLAGQILASRRPLVVSGMTIAMNAAVGGFANQLVLKTASSILLHATASEPEDDPLTVEDWATTIYDRLGIVADKELMAPGDRPIEIVDGGKVVKGLIA